MTSQTISVPGYTGPERRRRLHMSDSQFGHIVDASVAAMTDSERLVGIDLRIGAVEDRLEDGGARMQRIEDKLDANTSTTQEVRDLLDSGKAFFRFAAGFGGFARWVGGIAGAAAAIWALIYTATHGGKPPG